MFIIVAGAGLIGEKITRILVENNYNVVVIDRDREVCEAVYAETGAMTVHGDATDIHVLTEAGAETADVVLCLMNAHADNIACALLSKSLGIPRIIARLRDPHYEEAYKQAGVTTIVNVADFLTDQIITEVEQPQVKQIVRVGGAEVYAVEIPKKAKSVGMKIMEITGLPSFPTECVFMGIYQEDGDFLIPRGGYTLEGGDTVFLISKPHYIKDAIDVLIEEK